MCLPGTTYFSNLGIQLEAATFISSLILIFVGYLLFRTATSENSASQRHDIIKRNVAQLKVETVNVLKEIICLCLTDIKYCRVSLKI